MWLTEDSINTHRYGLCENGLIKGRKEISTTGNEKFTLALGRSGKTFIKPLNENDNIYSENLN